MNAAVTLKLTVVKIKLFVRELPALFFTIFFTPMILIVFGMAYGNEPNPMFGNLGSVDISIPAYVAIIISGVALISLPIATAAAKERGEYRRLRLLPVKAGVYLAVDMAVYFLLALAGVVILTLVGRFAFGALFTANVLRVLVALAVSCAAFLSLGFLVAALSKTAMTAQAIGMFLSFGMMFISGAGMPLELMPESLRRVSDFMPLTYVVVLMRGVWKGDPLSAHPLPLLVLVGMAALCAALSSRVFRWE